MRDGKRPVFLTTEQITTLQDMILEKQYQLAAAQTDTLETASYGRLNEQMSHSTDLLLALASALPDEHKTSASPTTFDELNESA